jgi:hypothetical protein
LLGWELGDGLGHVRRLLAVARGLAGRGHHPVLALANVVEPAAVLRDEPFPVLPAPLRTPRAAREAHFQAASYADILAVRGFDDAGDLLALARSWQHLIDLVRPALVVCDHSPALCLAAYGVLPVVLVGTGFTVPPAELPVFPPLGTPARPVMPQEQVLEVVQQVQRRRGRPVPDSLGGLFAPAMRLVCTLPELDPYRALRREPAVGPLGELPPPLPPAPAPGYFAYLAGDFPGVDNLLGALAGTGLPGSVYVRGASRALLDFLRGRGLVVHERPAPLAEALAGASVILHHAGAGTTEAALAAGRPQLLFPRHLEQTLTSQALHALGVGVGLAGEQPLEALHAALRLLLGEPRFAAQARAWGEALWARRPGDPLALVVRRCLQLLSA